MSSRSLAALAVMPAVLVAAGCGGSPAKRTSSTVAPATTGQAPTVTIASGGPGALQAEAKSTATGDIPDNQVFLVYRSSAGWAIKYPEGWAQSGGSGATAFRDKNNIVRVVVQRGSLPSAAQVGAGGSLRRARITSAPASVTIAGAPALKVVYTTSSAPSPVTGKRVTLTVDRYYLAHAGRLATIDLGTPVGVDNVDAYRLMVHSFRWR
ncbi:MAG: hypothetical protein ACXVRE_04505 [Gaiellaceae bacterium]